MEEEVPQINERVRLGLVVNVRTDNTRPFGFIRAFRSPADCYRRFAFGNGDTYFGAEWLQCCNPAVGDVVLFDINSTTDARGGEVRRSARFVSARIPVFVLAEEDGSYRTFLLHEIAFEGKLSGPTNERVQTGLYTAHVFQQETEYGTILNAEHMEPMPDSALVRRWALRLMEQIAAHRSLAQTLSAFWTPLRRRYPAISGLSVVYHFIGRWLESEHCFLHFLNGVAGLKGQPIALRLVLQAAEVLQSVPLKYALWLNRILESPPKLTTAHHVNGWKCVLTTSDFQTVWSLFKELASDFPKRPETQHTQRYILEQRIHINTVEDCDEIISVLKRTRLLYPHIQVQEAHIAADKTQFIIRLWQEGLLSDLSETVFKAHLKESNAAELATELSVLSSVQQIQLLSHSENYAKEFQSASDSAFYEILPPILFVDIESDGDKVRELAWHYKGETTEYPKIEEGISALNAIIALDNPIVAGHNIIRFDLPILESKGLATEKLVLLDTLLLETVLQPTRNSHALRTGHRASADVKVTAALFNSQIARLCLADNELVTELIKLLPASIGIAVADLRKQSIQSFLAARNDLFSGDNFFHRASEKNAVPAEIAFAIKASRQRSQMVIVPEIFWSQLLHSGVCLFANKGHSYGYVVSARKVTELQSEMPWLALAAKHYIGQCAAEERIPHLAMLSPYLRFALEGLEARICFTLSEALTQFSDAAICISPDFIAPLLRRPPYAVNAALIVAPLLARQSAHRLLAEITMSDLLTILPGSKVWMQFSGGTSLVPLDNEDALRLSSNLAQVGDCWLQRIGRNRFKAWQSSNLDATLSVAGINSVVEVDWPKPAPSIRLRALLGRDMPGDTQRSVNPESFYRSLYWTYAAKLISRLKESLPIVLLIEAEEELDKVAGLFRSRGYYVPERKAGLRRKLELLASAGNKLALLPLSSSQLAEVLQCHLDTPFQFVRESLRLSESALLTPHKNGEEYHEKSGHSGEDAPAHQDEDEKDDETEMPKRSLKTQNAFAGLQRELLLVQHQASAIIALNQANIYTLLDPRVGDYPGLNEEYGIGIQRCATWELEEDYKRDLEKARVFFGSVGVADEATKLSPEEAIERLRPIFLEAKDSWRDEQLRYFDIILPQEQHVLVSLPTGGGKSVLFQGPALLQGALTSRLSIVIVPLKSLMEDQVDSLAKRGFYTSVDYLSGDRQQYENREVLRRLAGGEITLLYITPERFRSRAFVTALQTRMMVDARLAYFVFDEAHCISQWGQEFRPDFFHAYTIVKEYLRAAPDSLTLLLFSATVSEQVFLDISRNMPRIERLDLFPSGYNPVRDHIRMSFFKDFIEEDRLSPIIARLNADGFNPASSRAIIFTTSRSQAEEGAAALSDKLTELDCASGDANAFSVAHYHAGLSGEQREEVYASYKKEDGALPIIFATKAFGMGVDIGNIHHVFHFSPPSAFEDFLQEVGRAGRNKEMLESAGFGKEARPIDAVTLLSRGDFSAIKLRMKKTKLAWSDIGMAHTAIHAYLGSFGPLKPDADKAWPVPLNLLSDGRAFFNKEDIVANKFRLSLYWLEQLGRIRLGFYTPTHYKVLRASLKVAQCASEGLTPCLEQIIIQASAQPGEGDSALISIGGLAGVLHCSTIEVVNKMAALHGERCIEIAHYIYLVPSISVDEEFTAFQKAGDNRLLVRLHWAVLLATAILKRCPHLDEYQMGSEELDKLAEACLHEAMLYLPERIRISAIAQEQFVTDLKRRRKHVFTLLRKLTGIRVKSEITGITPGVGNKQHAEVVQLIYNGGKSSKAWVEELQKFSNSAAKLCGWAYDNSRQDVTGKTSPFEYVQKYLPAEGVPYLEDLLHITGLFGYIKTAGSIMPTGIGLTLLSDEAIKERDSQHSDSDVFASYEEWGKLRELKMIALQAMSEMPLAEQDGFIKAYFKASSFEEILALLHEAFGRIQRINFPNLPEDKIELHPAMQAFAEETLKAQVAGLSEEQKAVYDAPLSQHISVIAGPGSGKTHTLALRVARLIQQEDVPAADILVVAYNRAVVTELKARLQQTFRALGYQDITKPLRICTYAELALKLNPDIRQQPFKTIEEPNVWECDLCNRLQENPAHALMRLGAVKYLLVDEFQDATELRIEILARLIKLSEGKLFVIGDPNQSIYGFERKAAGSAIDPLPYYGLLEKGFSPLAHYALTQNFRSMPAIVAASNALISHWIPRYQGLKPLVTKREPFPNMPREYCTIRHAAEGLRWWDELKKLLLETGDELQKGDRREPQRYQQIAILFRSNNEVFRAKARLSEAAIPGIRIRVQGNQPTEFMRFRECHFFLHRYAQEAANETPIPNDFREQVNKLIGEQKIAYSAWNQFYLSVVHALVLQYLDDAPEDIQNTYTALCDHICESTRRDDGQLWKVYEKYKDIIDPGTNETEVLLTTMHRVKGLEFDAVMVPPSFSELPFMPGTDDEAVIRDLIDEERRLMYVAYSRAKYRLVVIQGEREGYLMRGNAYQPSEAITTKIGQPLKDGLKDVNISWGANAFCFHGNSSKSILSNMAIARDIAQGDELLLVKDVSSNGTFYEVKTSKGAHIATLSRKAGAHFTASSYAGYYVNEIVAWTEEQAKAKGFADKWCDDARKQGYIYVVSIAGYGKPIVP